MTRLELRRLALQATRRPELLSVLQDALLESSIYGPAFEVEMDRARRLAESNLAQPPYFAYVVVLPVAFMTRLRSQDQDNAVFHVIGFDERDFDWSDLNGFVRILARRGTVPVFVARTGIASPRWRAPR